MKKRLSEIVEFLDHKRIPIKDSVRASIQGDIPYYGANGQVDSINKFLFNEPLVLLAEDGGHFGSKEKPIAYKIEGKSWVNNHAHVLRPKNGGDIDFITHALSFYDVTKFISGSTRLKLTKSDVMRMEIPYPPISVQKRVAFEINTLKSALQKRRQANALTEQVLQSAFLGMFGDPVRKEKGWPIKKMGAVISSIRYGTGSPPIYGEHGIPFIRATNIKNGTVVENGLVFISKEEASKISKCRIKQGDLIIVRSGANTGDTAIIPREYDFAYAGYDLIVEAEKPTGVFYNHILNSDYGRKIIEPLSRRAGQPHLNAEQIKEIEFYFPPLKLQNEFSDLVNKIEVLRQKQKESERHLQELFNSLMQRYFG